MTLPVYGLSEGGNMETDSALNKKRTETSQIFFDNLAEEDYFNEVMSSYFYDYCNDVMWDELEKPKSMRNLKQVSDCEKMKDFLLTQLNITLEKILAYASDLQSKDAALELFCKVFDYFSDEISPEYYDKAVGQMEKFKTEYQPCHTKK